MKRRDELTSEDYRPQTPAERLAELTELHGNLYVDAVEREKLIPGMDRKGVVTSLSRLAEKLSSQNGDTGDRRAFAKSLDPDIEELEAEAAKAEERAAHLHQLATHDALTQSLNRYGLEEYLARHPERHALLYIDLTNFKKVNDMINHARGDQLIVDVAGILSNVMRDGDTIARPNTDSAVTYDDAEGSSRVVRMGGDEFVIVLASNKDSAGISDQGGRDPEYDQVENIQKTLEAIKKRIDTALDSYLARDENQDVAECGFRLAIGGAVFNKDDDLATVLLAAEQAMTENKAAQHEQLGKYRP